MMETLGFMLFILVVFYCVWPEKLGRLIATIHLAYHRAMSETNHD